VEGLVA